ncbi:MULTISPECIES: hypothetical protein [unclassified Bradyrhizobium]|uniref:hypothetical protein n=1 Tax=unclassified Bradyrhizobium TaxID=2631580 RepID=UPI002916F4E0|nr:MULTISPECIES: hypothetical protein [unclassified Bradyrhizobium]
MNDILGPANAANTVTQRPAETRVFGSNDSWFQDCSSPSANDGTRVMAAWLNGIIAQLRKGVRVNGNLAAGGPVVAEDNSDAMFANAIQYLIQRNQPNYADDIGTANNLVVNLSPVPQELKKGQVVVTTVKFTNSGPTVLNLNGSGNAPVVRSDGSALAFADILAGSMQAFGWDGSRWQLLWMQRQPGSPIYLQAAQDYYVSNSGSDANTGLSLGAAWATLQHAMSVLARFNLNGFNVHVHVSDGNYAALSCAMLAGSGYVYWVGNHSAPANCVITGVNVSALTITNCGQAHQFDGFTVTAGGTYGASGPLDGMNGVQVSGAGTSTTLTNFNWGTCSGSHLAASQACVVTYAGAMYVSGSPQGNNPMMTSGWHVFCVDGAIIQQPSLTSVTLAILVSVVCGNGGGWVQCATLAFCQIVYASISANGGATVTGQRFNVLNWAVISVAGSGDNHYPGSIAGSRGGGTGIYG